MISSVPSSGGIQAEYRGLSTDTKPTTGVENGSVYIEMDTGTLYFFDEASGTWLEWQVSG